MCIHENRTMLVTEYLSGGDVFTFLKSGAKVDKHLMCKLLKGTAAGKITSRVYVSEKRRNDASVRRGFSAQGSRCKVIFSFGCSEENKGIFCLLQLWSQ